LRPGCQDPCLSAGRHGSATAKPHTLAVIVLGQSKQYNRNNFMVGILGGLLISWLLLWIYDKKNLKALGVNPTKGRVLNFLFGLFASAICCAIGFFAIATITKANLTVNEKFNGKIFLVSSWWSLKSVIYEELLFRGVLLYILIQTLGTKMACTISAISFGIYHWFSYGVFGDPMQMTYIFILTGIGGLMFAYAFALTKSLYLPLGLHLGWNLIAIVVFSQGPLGNQLLVSSNGQKLIAFFAVLFFLYQILVLPLITYWYVRRQTSKPLMPTTNNNR